MPDTSQDSHSETDHVPFVISHKVPVITVLALVIFVFAGMSWWQNVYNNPRRVFETMLRNNLATNSVTRSTTTSENGTPVDKTEQISFVPKVAVMSRVKITQQGPAGSSNVISESIGTLEHDFNRYVQIDTDQKGGNGQKLDYSSVQNVWGKSDPNQQTPQYFSQSALSLVMFANLDSATRDRVLTIIRDKKAYEVDYSKVKPQKVGDKSALVFPVKVNVTGYVEALSEVAKAIGLGKTTGLDPEQYVDQPAIELTITVDKLSRQVLEVDYNGQQKETYHAYGLSLPIELPKNAIPAAELQQKLEEVK